MQSGITVRSLLSLLKITVYKGESGKKLEAFSCRTQVVSWPTLIFLAIGTFLAAIALGVGILSTISHNFPSEEEGRFTVALTSGIGGFLIVLGYFLFIRLKTIFFRPTALSLALGGEFLIVMGIAGEGYSLIWGTIVALALLVLLLRLFPDALHQIGSATIFCAIFVFALREYIPEYAEPISTVVLLPFATLFLFYPLRNLDMRPMAMIFILFPLLVASEGDFAAPAVTTRVIYMAFYAFLLYLLWPALSFVGKRFAVISFIPVFIFSMITSSGIAASFFIIFVAYMLGSRLVMSAGILANILFTVLFYAGLDLTLSEKSLLLFLSAFILMLMVIWLQKKEIQANDES
ncbi:MAG: DUF4401 domain-containing protein [Alphaproteobacteria bacterium]|nr:DUF4401 domain-containing protein [Alphaproteobacteria bacterium]